jgi:hypothetical protein
MEYINDCKTGYSPLVIWDIDEMALSGRRNLKGI